MDYSEKEIEKALQKIMNEGGVKSHAGRQLPNGGHLEIVTEGGTFECGAVFEAETVKGHKNYIVFMMVRQGWVYYNHGDKAKKVSEEHFQRAISSGDIVFIPREKVDIERIALSVIGMLAMSNGLSFNDYLKVIYGYGQGSELRPVTA